ncbi:MAG: hypothetical protein ACW7DX_18100, partial [Paraglaciecola chathamensis]
SKTKFLSHSDKVYLNFGVKKAGLDTKPMNVPRYRLISTFKYLAMSKKWPNAAFERIGSSRSRV